MAGRQRTDYAARSLRVLIYIQRNLDGDLSPETLAGRAAFSSCHFHRIFTAAMGETLGALVRRLRLERAAMALRGSATSVTDAAFEAGYESVEAFSRDGVVNRLQLNPGGIGLMNIREETLAEKRLLAMPHGGPYGANGATFERLMAWGGPRGRSPIKAGSSAFTTMIRTRRRRKNYAPRRASSAVSRLTRHTASRIAYWPAASTPSCCTADRIPRSAMRGAVSCANGRCRMAFRSPTTRASSGT